MIAVTKTGNVVYFAGAEKKASLIGDQHNAPAIVRWLGETYDNVVFVGHYQGELPPGVRGVKIDLRNVNEWDPDAQEQCAQNALEELAFDGECLTWIDLCGPCPTMSWVANPWNILVQVSGAKYTGPIIRLMHLTRARRLAVVTDPRNYPRNHEMNAWPELIPVAVIGQENSSRKMRVRHLKFQVECKYAAAENWFSHGMAPRSPNATAECTVVAHSHLKDGRWSKNRDATWLQVFTKLNREIGDWRLVGKGWELFSRQDVIGEHWTGVVNPDKIWDTFAGCAWGVVLPPSKNFLTTKVRKYAISGSLPMLWNHGALRYDDAHAVFPPDHPLRRDDWGPDKWSPEDRAEALEDVLDKTVPDFALLRETIAACESGEKLDWRQHGGYVR